MKDTADVMQPDKKIHEYKNIDKNKMDSKLEFNLLGRKVTNFSKLQRRQVFVTVHV